MRIYVFLLLFSLTTKGQALIFEGQVFSQSSNKPIPYASIKNIKLNKVIDADKDGRFEIPASTGDSVLITCIGYKDNYVQINGIHSPDSCFLEDNIVELLPIKVSNLGKLMIGTAEKKQNRSFIGENVSERYEAAILVKIPDTVKTYKVSGVIIRQKEFDEQRLTRLHIYSVDSNGLPKDELLKNQIILGQEMHKKNLFEIDLRDQDIVLADNSSIFVGIQWLTSASNVITGGRDIGIGETFKTEEMLTFRRGALLNGKWHVEFEHAIYIPSDGTAPGKLLEYTPGKGKGNPINILASAEIQILEKK